LRLAAVVSFAVTGLLSTVLYFHDYVRPTVVVGNPLTSLETPLRLLKYYAQYFLSSWSHDHMSTLEVFALAAVTIVVFAVLVPGLSHAASFRVLAIQLVLTMAFCAATAFITAAGRLNFGTAHAFASRYQTVALLFWCCLGLLLLGASFSRPQGRSMFVIAQLFLLLLFARGAFLARYPMEAARQHQFELNATAASLLTGVPDPAQLRWAFFLNRLLNAAGYMEANHLSVFSGSTFSELGKPLEAVFTVDASDDCVGALESVAPIIDQPSGRPGLRVTGWAWDNKRHQPAAAIVVTTDGVISGLGAAGQWRAAAPVNTRDSGSHSGYIGYFPAPQPGSGVEVYAILRNHPYVACHFATR
jgi:hypothetical protein